MADEKKGSPLADLKSRLKGGLKSADPAAAPVAPTGAPIIPGQTSTPAPFPVVPDSSAAPPVLPPVVALPKPATSNNEAAPLLPPPGMPPLVGPPGLELPAPPAPQVAAPVAPLPPPEPIYIDPYAGSYKLEDDEAKNDKFDAKRALWWVKFAAPSAALGLTLGLIYGYGAFGRDYNTSRTNQVTPFKESFDGLSKSMNDIIPKVMALKDGPKDVDVNFPAAIEEDLKKVNLLSSDALKQYPATFLQASTLSLLFQYRFLTDQFYKQLTLHKKKVENSKDELAKASKGQLQPPKYVVALLDQTETGGIISGSICTVVGDVKTITQKEPEEVEEEEETPGKPKPAKPAEPKMVDVTYKIYNLKSSFDLQPFERKVRVKKEGTADIREITNPELIPDYATQLLADYQDRVKNLKTLATLLQTLQEQLKPALEAEISREVSFSF